MNPSEAGNIIRYMLVNTSAIFDIVGYGVRPIKAAQSDSYPYIIYEAISMPSLQSNDGNSGWYKARYQLSILATSLAACQNIANLCRAALDGLSGTIAGFKVQRISFEDERDIFNDNSAVDGVYMLQQDYFITFQV